MFAGVLHFFYIAPSTLTASSNREEYSLLSTKIYCQQLKATQLLFCVLYHVFSLLVRYLIVLFICYSIKTNGPSNVRRENIVDGWSHKFYKETKLRNDLLQITFYKILIAVPIKVPCFLKNLVNQTSFEFCILENKYEGTIN